MLQPSPMSGSFYDSMPDRYRRAFDKDASREHAAIVARRAGAPVHGEIWQRLPRGGVVACFVADDRPGLLSFIAAALAARSMDVIAAQVYTRPPAEGRPAEAVDFLWLRREGDLGAPVLEADIARIAETVRALAVGEVSIDAVVRKARAARPAPAGALTRVTFNEGPDEGLAVLTVETFDRPGLLLAITCALFGAQVQITASDATTQKGRVVDTFTLAELDGTPIHRQRRGVVQMAVLGAIDALARGDVSSS